MHADAPYLEGCNVLHQVQFDDTSPALPLLRLAIVSIIKLDTLIKVQA